MAERAVLRWGANGSRGHVTAAHSRRRMVFDPDSGNACSVRTVVYFASQRVSYCKEAAATAPVLKTWLLGSQREPGNSIVELPARSQEGRRRNCSTSIGPLLPRELLPAPCQARVKKVLLNLRQGVMFLFFRCLKKSKKKGLLGSPGVSSSAFCSCN